MGVPGKNIFVFSYGTLKRGFPNYSIMEKAQATYISEVQTLHSYPLLQSGKWNVPFMIDHKDYPNSYPIKGELFEVDQKGLQVIDEFEGVDRGYYKRLKTKILFLDKDRKHSKNVWCYFRYEHTADLLADASRFIPVFGKKELKKYIPVALRPTDWNKNT